MNAAVREHAGLGGRTAPPAGAANGTRLRLSPNPLRLVFSAAPWLAARYLAGYIFVAGWVLFSVAFTATVTAAVFAVTLAGIPLLAAAAGVVRSCADVERSRLRRVLGELAPGGYRPDTGAGVIARARTRWRDPATWRDVAYLIGLWGPLFILDTIVFTVWLTLLAGLTLPLWYWAPRGNDGFGYTSPTTVHGLALGYFPHGPHGPGGAGLYVDTLPRALLAAAVFLALFLIFNYVLVSTARAHAAVARGLLRPPGDPLAEAKEVLAGAGPLKAAR